MENEAIGQTDWFSSPAEKRQPFQELRYLPDSPPEKQPHVHTDDLVQTSEIKSTADERVDFVYVSRPVKQPILLVGGCEDITIGRGGNATIKIGKRNRQISRIHARIDYKADTHEYFFNVLGLNGAMVDNVLYRQHDVIQLKDDALIDILGSKITFMCPDMPASLRQPVAPPSPVLEPALDEPQQNEEEPEVEEPKADQSSQEDSKQDEERKPKLSETEELELEQPKQEEQEELSIDDVPLSPAPKEQHQEIQVDYAEVIIDALVFSRKSSMPVSDICSRILSNNPTYKVQPREVWIEKVQQVLKEKPFFGEIVRKGKTADGSPKENLYYYNSEQDPVEWRRAEYTHVGRSARKCTLQDKQYFWKIPPKLGRNRNAYVPPPAKAYEKRKGHEEEMRSAKKPKSDD
ncbi:hypothetical protein BJV82DRAFT_590951 [Fennellomyces sp. T-0311]|nr:hypothetical protein BJV82DRAFT_590951 [Fennellomyces sp. T-0311]